MYSGATDVHMEVALVPTAQQADRGARPVGPGMSYRHIHAFGTKARTWRTGKPDSERWRF